MTHLPTTDEGNWVKNPHTVGSSTAIPDPLLPSCHY